MSKAEKEGIRGYAVHAWFMSVHLNILLKYAVEINNSLDQRSMARLRGNNEIQIPEL